MAARRSGVFRWNLQLSRPRHHVLVLLPRRARAPHAKVLVVEAISHHFPNDSVRFGLRQEHGCCYRILGVRLPLAVLPDHELAHAGLLRTLCSVLHPGLPRQERENTIRQKSLTRILEFNKINSNLSTRRHLFRNHHQF
jgi:hypothetical protein